MGRRKKKRWDANSRFRLVKISMRKCSVHISIVLCNRLFKIYMNMDNMFVFILSIIN